MKIGFWIFPKVYNFKNAKGVYFLKYNFILKFNN